MKPFNAISNAYRSLTSRIQFSMRTKLIFIFAITTTIPLVLVITIAMMQSRNLAKELYQRAEGLKNQAFSALTQMGQITTDSTVSTINDLAIQQLERLSTTTAQQIADFLYGRDKEILEAALLRPDENVYRNFLKYKTRPLIKQQEWVLADDQKSWVPREPLKTGAYSASTNTENDIYYHNRPAELWNKEDRPLYLEMTYLDTAGNEIVKVTTSDQMDPVKKNVSNRLNTYVKAETYFPELKKLKPGEIYVSDVIGAYVKSHLIGMYTPENAAAKGLKFDPQAEAYAGRENPLGKRFKGIIRWATPVVTDGVITGYVTLALDHDHIMEFVDHITPMEERYVQMPSAYEGNYAFIWDYKCRSIAHPRHHSIVGFDPDTGEPQVPWLEESIYNEWKASGLPYTQFIKGVPEFQDQSRQKKPAPEL
ncbi:MAG: hybrid sensor histidine kinase/response regulator, partial [Treponema sp.]|nr:hybrid sensor histidine kinase/response regulator [Treponema sp.]